jgi:hypothetical protein
MLLCIVIVRVVLFAWKAVDIAHPACLSRHHPLLPPNFDLAYGVHNIGFLAAAETVCAQLPPSAWPRDSGAKRNDGQSQVKNRLRNGESLFLERSSCVPFNIDSVQRAIEQDAWSQQD